MNIIDKRIADLVPDHYRSVAPRFITFLEKYYEWLYRSSGLTEGEIEDLKSDTSWLEKDIDRFIATGQIRYFDMDDAPDRLYGAIIDINATRNAGTEAVKIPDNFTLENDFNGYITTDGGEFTDSDSVSVELSTVENTILDGWFNSMGFDRIKRSYISALNSVDQVLMLSLLKHIYAIKGTEASIKLFFNLFFNEAVTLFQPKPLIAVIDENWILDGAQVIRDDELYQEYSYVIQVSGNVDGYKQIFENVYIKLIHPAGFRVKLKQV